MEHQRTHRFDSKPYVGTKKTSKPSDKIGKLKVIDKTTVIEKDNKGQEVTTVENDKIQENQELNEKTPKKSTTESRTSDEVPSAPKKSKKEEVKEADISIESNIDGNEDVKDQIIVELKLQIVYQEKQIEDNKILKKKAHTRDKTLKILENTGIKNKALESENEDSANKK